MWPAGPLSIAVTFEHGVPVALDGDWPAKPALFASLSERLADDGSGRYLYSKDATFGLIARILFERPGLRGLSTPPGR